MQTSHAALTQIAQNSGDAETAFIQMLEASEKLEGSRAFGYLLGKSILKHFFPLDSIERAMYGIALFDESHEDPRTAKKAGRIVSKFENKPDRDLFLKDLKTTGVAVLMTDDILWLAHPCQKTTTNLYQVSCFVKGQGVSGDTTHTSIDEILSPSALGAGIPYDAKYLAPEHYEAIEAEFKTDCFSGQ